MSVSKKSLKPLPDLTPCLLLPANLQGCCPATEEEEGHRTGTKKRWRWGKKKKEEEASLGCQRLRSACKGP